MSAVLSDLLKERGANLSRLRRFRALIVADGCVECAERGANHVGKLPDGTPVGGQNQDHFHARTDRAASLRLSIEWSRHALLTLLDLVLGEDSNARGG